MYEMTWPLAILTKMITFYRDLIDEIFFVYF